MSDAVAPKVRLSVLVADDSGLFRHVLRDTLEGSDVFVVVAEANDARAALTMAASHRPDVVLLDVAMTLLDGLQTIPGLRECSPLSRVIVLSGMSTPRMSNLVVDYGADAYIEKRHRPAELLLRLAEICGPPDGYHWTVPAGPSDQPAGNSPSAAMAGDWVGGLFDRPHAGLVVETLDGRIIRVNDEFCRLASADRHDVVGCNLADLVHVLDVDSQAALRRRLVDDGALASQIELRLRTADRRAPWVLMTAALLRDREGVAREIVTEIVDIGDHKRSETLARVTGDAAALGSHELRRPNDELAHFASVAAHDLRSPLQAIAGFAALLDRHYGPGLDDRGRDFVHWIVTSAARMETLIDGLLACALVGSGPVVAVPVPLDAVIEDVLAALQAEITATGGTVTWDALPVVAGDVTQLTQVLRNLVGNALKFVPQGTTPVVHVAAEETAGGWCIAVSDNGVGINPAERDDVFEMFKRLHPPDRYAGTGIGLAICKRIVETAGGRIWVDPGPDGGSTFRFIIPGELSTSEPPGAI